MFHPLQAIVTVVMVLTLLLRIRSQQSTGFAMPMRLEVLDDTLASSGVCNDQLTGGPGADKFICGEGLDTLRDFSSEEGDVIVDPQNCEKTI
jgi:hypothetical protein